MTNLKMLIQLLFLISGFFIPSSCHPSATPDYKSSVTPDDISGLHIIRPLPIGLNECSGLTMLTKSLFVALNDGGHKAILYVFDANKNTEARKVYVDNAVNADWEEVTTDGEYVYIGDTGNNGGTRQNLTIYKIKKDDVIKKDHVTAEKIVYKYQDQTSFHDSNRHNFDCEALVAVGDSLYLFSKDRGDLRTNIYSVPKMPGAYQAGKLSSFDSKGLVTGADYRSGTAGPELILIGYELKNHSYHPFLVHFTNFTGTHFFNGKSARITLSEEHQTESVLFYSDHKVYISNESSKNEKGYLFELDIL
ncbi:MAG: hypothetical protein ABIQ02_02055 [Saprospiraceae bacterium]